MIISSEGDAGDCVFCLCVEKNLPGGPHTFLIEEKSAYTASGKSKEIAENLLNFIKRLAESQPYISSCRMMERTDSPDWRSGGFREARLHDTTKTLLSAHLRHLHLVKRIRIEIDPLQPWLTVEPSKETKGMVVINRTQRYQNKFFNWKAVVDHYQGRIVFVGLPHEWKAFCEEFGEVSYRETKDLLDVARLVAGSALFIGNQSCANACNEGLKHDSILECSLDVPDCVFARSNTQICVDGKCYLPNVSGSGSLDVPRAKFTPNYQVQTSQHPRRGWKCEGLEGPTYKALKRLVMAEKRITDKEAHKRIIDELHEECPEYFAGGSTSHEENSLVTALFAVRQANHHYVKPKEVEK